MAAAAAAVDLSDADKLARVQGAGLFCRDYRVLTYRRGALVVAPRCHARLHERVPAIVTGVSVRRGLVSYLPLVADSGGPHTATTHVANVEHWPGTEAEARLLVAAPPPSPILIGPAAPESYQPRAGVRAGAAGPTPVLAPGMLVEMDHPIDFMRKALAFVLEIAPEDQYDPERVIHVPQEYALGEEAVVRVVSPVRFATGPRPLSGFRLQPGVVAPPRERDDTRRLGHDNRDERVRAARRQVRKWAGRPVVYYAHW